MRPNQAEEYEPDRLDPNRTFLRPRTKKPGRPRGWLAPETIEIRQAIMSLTIEYEVMTVRQIFYALTVRGIVPKEENQGYRRVQRQVLELRRAGLLEWSFISDATRWRRGPMMYDRAEDALLAIKSTYRRNLWQSQDERIEVWLEKDALAGVVMEATVPWGVDLMVSHGTSSATFIHEAAVVARTAYERANVSTIVFGLFDFDAGGARIARAIDRGLDEHLGELGWIVEFERIAVLSEQVEDWNLPTRPAKKTDPEAHKFGTVAVELDAIPPDRLIGLVDEAIASRVDADAWKKEQIVEQNERELLSRLAVRT